MIRSHIHPLALLVSALFVAGAAHAAPLTKTEFDAGNTRINDTYKEARTACASLAANARDVCVEEGRAVQKVARAELDFSYTGKARDQNKIWVARAEAAYAVAKEKCDDQSGNAKAVCRKEAKAVEVKALADAKLMAKVGDAKTDADGDKRDADYRVAAEKCDALTGDAKNSCMASAKQRFGKG